MKRKLLGYLLSTVAVLFFWQTGFSQNLLTNGNMESWTDATTIDGWTVSGEVAQESTIVHSGTYSAKQVAKDKLYQDIDVVPGKTYNISLWYYVVGGDGSDARIWSAWKDGSGAYLSDNADELKGPNNNYLTSAESWQKYEVSLKAPASAAKLHFEVRTYKPSSGSFAVYWDDFSVEVSGGADTLAPTWTTGYPQAIHVEDTRGTFLVNMSEAGKVYYIVVAKDAAAPTAAQVKAGADYGSVSVVANDSISVTKANSTVAADFTGVQPSTSVDVWFVAEDEAGNLQSAPVKVSVTTTAARALTFDNPKANDSFNVGDSLKLEWTSSNIDSLIVTIRPASSFVTVVMTDGPFAAADGHHSLLIPKDAMTGNYSLVLHDYYDTTFKKTVNPVIVVDNRSLQLTAPKDNDTVYVGDTLTFRWTSNNVDSVLIGGYIGMGGPDGGYFMLTGDMDHFDTASFKPIPASPGVWKIYLDPDNMGGSIKIDSIIIWNAADMHMKDFASPVYIVDTLPMRITNSMPSFGMTDFMASSGINCNFSCDSIVKGSGYLHLKKADGTTVEDLDTSMVDINSNGIWFMPNPALVPGESYYIEIDSGFVKCADGSKTFPGLSGKKWSFTVASSSIYFSEYIEGSSSNKALEIYNPTKSDVNLDNYMIASSFNGSGINWDGDMYHFPKGYILKAGHVFVLANASASQDILKVANDTLAYNESGYVCGFNGNDARVLLRSVSNGNDYMEVDQIGEPWDNPGDGWDVAGVTAATKDHTLLRKRSVMIGTTDWGMSAGSDADNSEWIVKDKNYFGNIGFPTPMPQNGITVQFNVDMRYAKNFDPSKDSVIIAGGFPKANWNEPGTNPDLRMSDADSNGIYTITLSIPSAMALEYKYFVNAGWGGGEWDGGDNRKVNIANDTTLNDIFGYADNKLPALDLPFSEDFDGVTNNGPLNLTGWMNTNVADSASRLWIGKVYQSNGYAQFSSYKSTSPHGDTAWLITPALNMDNTTDEILSFDINVGYWTHEGLKVFVSTDFDQTKEGISKATWTDVTSSFTIPTVPTDTYGTFAPAGNADLSSYTGNLNVAFVYYGDAASGKTTTYQIDSVKVEGTTGIRNISLSDKVELYPNPGNGLFNIALHNTLKGSVSMRIVDITGRIVMEKRFDHAPSTVKVDISTQPSNLYFITISDAHNTVVKKFMKR